MALIKAVQRAFAKFAPVQLAGSWDNTGLLLEPAAPNDAHRVVLTIDLTPNVYAKLPESTACIVAYHPVLFRPVKALTMTDPKMASILGCAARGIGIYCPHTALDSVKGGINDFLADGLGKGQRTGLENVENPPPDHANASIGRLLQLDEPVSLNTLIGRIKKILNMKTVMVARASATEFSSSIQSVAICAGSGGSVLSGVQADVYWTGEMQHHDILAAVGQGTSVILCNHTNIERPYLAHLQTRLQSLLDEERAAVGLTSQRWEVVISEADADPVEFV